MKKKLLPNLHQFNMDKKAKAEGVGTDFIYVLAADEGLVKIGMTNDLWGRFEKLCAMNPKRLEPLMFWVCRNGRSVEAALHALFKDYRHHGEWFYLGDHSRRYDAWKYRHLALSALLTCTHPPVPIKDELLFYIQYEHILDDEPELDKPGGADFTGCACYPPELFAGFDYKGGKAFGLVDWSDEMRVRYGFPPGIPAGRKSA